MKIKNILYLFLLTNITVIPSIFTMEGSGEKTEPYKPLDPEVARFLIAMSAAYPELGSEGKFTGKTDILPAELLDMIAGVIIAFKNGEALVEAFEKDDKDKIERLLKKRYIDVNVKSKSYMTRPLFETRTPQIYISKTPLMYASVKGNIEMVKRLLQKGADPNIQADMKTFQGAKLYGQIDNHSSALSNAVLDNRPEVVEVLLKAGADPNMQDYNGNAALIYASRPEVVKMLLDHAANINQQNNNGNTLLHIVARGFRFEHGPEIVKILLERGADLNIRNKEGRTALDEARKRGESEIIELLKEKQEGK